jgi:hypothetical protein
MSRIHIALCALALAASASISVQPAAAGANARPRLHGLQPGRFEVLTQGVPIRIVFIGYDPQQIDVESFKASLPATYKPAVRYPQFFGLRGREMGLSHEFTYSFEFKAAPFADRFFGALAKMGRPGPRTAVQQYYNDQAGNILDVPAEVLYLDAPSVEAWLHRNDPGRNDRAYTIYFLNWYGRPDFRFHVYEKSDEPDVDTGHNFGQRASRRVIAWGGSSSRTWFHDLSAGPEIWAGNANVDAADLDGDAYPDYRIPPIWEFADGGYRPPDELWIDLFLLTRYVAINLLFTSSPLFDPMLTAPGAGGAKIAHVTTLEDDDDPATSGQDYFKADVMRARLRELEPYYRWHVGESSVDPIDADARAALQMYASAWIGGFIPGCWQAFGTPFASLQCFFSEHSASYFPDYRPNDYVGRVVSFNTAQESTVGFVGLSDSNWIDGAQGLNYVFVGPGRRSQGYGVTNMAVHEFGHHIGLSHPHDGYDSENAEVPGYTYDYIASGDFYFAWAGDESHTAMHYLFTSTRFGQFNRDNLHRWESAGYVNWSNALAEAVLAHPDAHRVRGLVLAADLLTIYGKAQFRNWEYGQSAAALRGAYELLLTAAQQIDASSTSLMLARVPLADPITPLGCTLRFPTQ